MTDKSPVSGISITIVEAFKNLYCLDSLQRFDDLFIVDPMYRSLNLNSDAAAWVLFKLRGRDKVCCRTRDNPPNLTSYTCLGSGEEVW